MRIGTSRRRLLIAGAGTAAALAGLGWAGVEVSRTGGRPVVVQQRRHHQLWSSGHCDAPHGSQPTTLKPKIELSFSISWNGKATNNGCANREVPPAGKYELVGRLDTKLSAPATVQLT